MNEDMSEMLKNFSQMLNNQQMPDNIKNILNSMNTNNTMSSNSSSTGTHNFQNNPTTNSTNLNNSKNSFNSKDSENHATGNNTFDKQSSSENINNDSTNFNNIFGDFDINTILKIQKIMNSINNDKQNDSRANLLMSLKPYLKDSRKSKIDQYVQLMKMGKIFEIINPLGGDKKNV